MNPLPQRKKTAEELNQLRDQLGIHPHAAPPSAPPAATSQPVVPPAAPDVPYHRPPPPPPKPVRSLRKSERDPAPRRSQSRSTSSFSNIPAQRRSSEELQELRRREALARFNPTGHPGLFPFPAPRWIIIPGYLFALFGFACHYWTEIQLPVTAGVAGLAVIVSLYILLRRPLSRHHAGFIAIFTLLSLVFASLHYFPHLRHAS